MADDASAGRAMAPDGLTGSFNVRANDKRGRDHRAKGTLRYTGDRYAHYQGTGEPFIQVGAQSPENFLAYYEFDGTEDHGGTENRLVGGLHHYGPHVRDWRPGDPTWKGGKGKGVIGALNYLAGKADGTTGITDDSLNGLWTATIDGVEQADGAVVESWSAVGIRLTVGGKSVQLTRSADTLTGTGANLAVVAGEYTAYDDVIEGTLDGKQLLLERDTRTKSAITVNLPGDRTYYAFLRDTLLPAAQRDRESYTQMRAYSVRSWLKSCELYKTGSWQRKYMKGATRTEQNASFDKIINAIDYAKVTPHNITRHSRLRDCGTANVFPSAGNEVCGIVYDISDADLLILDSFEDGYRREKLPIEPIGNSSEVLNALVYIAAIEKIVPPPNAEYRKLIVEGARHWNLPHAYVALLEAIEAS